MSEQSSLFVKVNIKRDQLDAFLQAAPEQPLLEQDWIDWWKSRNMYGKNELTASRLTRYMGDNNNAIVQSFKAAEYTITSSEYDVATEIWNFSIFFYSENFYEMIPGIAFIKSIAAFKKEEASDFGIIYNYFWGDDNVNAMIDFINGTASLTLINEKSQVDAEKLEYANNYLARQWEHYEKSIQ